METTLSKNESLLSQKEAGWDEIKKLYPNEWVLVGNPVKKANEYFITSDVPLHHSPNKQQLSLEGNQILESLGLKNFKVVYTGENKLSDRYMTGIFSQLPLGKRTTISRRVET